jgi:hypothetical protein
MEMQQNLRPAESLKTERNGGDIKIGGTSYPRVRLTALLSMPLQETQIEEDTKYSAGDKPIPGLDHGFKRQRTIASDRLPKTPENCP